MKKRNYQCPKTESIKIQITELAVGTTLRDTGQTEDPSTGRSKGVDLQSNDEDKEKTWTLWDD